MLKMTKELDHIFTKCKVESLKPAETSLVTLAIHLVRGDREGAAGALRAAVGAGVATEQLHRVACMSSCTAGPKIQEDYLSVLGSADIKGAMFHAAKGTEAHAGSAAGAARGLDLSVFKRQGLCSERSLDKATTHLVGLAACLAAGCVCSAGHIIEARNAGVSDEQLIRCACLASCLGGVRIKYVFLEAFLAAGNCKACAC